MPQDTLNLAVLESTHEKPPFKAGDIVTTTFWTNPKQQYRVTRLLWVGKTESSSGWLVYGERLSPVAGPGAPYFTDLCASWLWPVKGIVDFVPEGRTLVKVTPPKKTVSSKTLTVSKEILRLNEARLKAKNEFRKLRTGEAHLALLAADSRLAAAVSRALTAK